MTLEGKALLELMLAGEAYQREIARLRRVLQVIADNPHWKDHGARARGALQPQER